MTGSKPMHRCFSFGASTLVALMAAHRAASDPGEMTPSAFNQDAVDSVSAYLCPAGDRTECGTPRSGALILED